MNGTPLTLKGLPKHLVAGHTADVVAVDVGGVACDQVSAAFRVSGVPFIAVAVTQANLSFVSAAPAAAWLGRAASFFARKCRVLVPDGV